MKNILLATDLSTHDKSAFNRAVALMRSLNAELHIVHVIDDRYYYGLIETISSMVEQQIKNVLQDCVTDADEMKCIKLHIISGEPHSEIIKLANKIDAVCTVLGMHRKKSLELFVGTTADRVSRYNLGITLLAKNVRSDPYKNILHASDFSPAAQHALHMADQIAPQGRLLIAHFPRFSRGPFMSRHEAQNYRKTMTAMLTARLQQEVKYVLGDNRAAEIEFIIMDEAPVDGILKLAKQHEVDLLALGKHEHGHVEILLTGSVSRKLLKNPPCDVLIAKT